MLQLPLDIRRDQAEGKVVPLKKSKTPPKTSIDYTKTNTDDLLQNCSKAFHKLMNYFIEIIR